ncbi:hypothetical protein ABZS86_11400 [Streptomyces sp. NPDC005355]|uniref:hypothetical protein n=1 Tax=Streptomyces sp. NPDC005355 TaxID=3157038 RepID=UPI0033AF9908
MNAAEIEFAESGWVAITRDQAGHIGVKPVRMFELTAEGVTALTKTADGAMVPDPDVVEVIKTDSLNAAKLAAMHMLAEMAERATTLAELKALEGLGEWVVNWGGDGG